MKMKRILTRFILCSFILVLSTLVISCTMPGGGGGSEETPKPAEENLKDRYGRSEEHTSELQSPD